MCRLSATVQVPFVYVAWPWFLRYNCFSCFYWGLVHGNMHGATTLWIKNNCRGDPATCIFQPINTSTLDMGLLSLSLSQQTPRHNEVSFFWSSWYPPQPPPHPILIAWVRDWNQYSHGPKIALYTHTLFSKVFWTWIYWARICDMHLKSGLAIVLENREGSKG